MSAPSNPPPQVPFEAAPPAPTDADALRESAARAALRGGSFAVELPARPTSKTEGDTAAQDGAEDAAAAPSGSPRGAAGSYDVWGGHGAWRDRT